MKPTPADLRALARRDPALGRAMKRLEPFPGFPTAEYRRRTPYEALARAIVFQQLAGAAALVRGAQSGNGDRFGDVLRRAGHRA